jgi:hypothetical protein
VRWIVAALALGAPAAGAADWSLARLFDGIAKHPPREASFTERKFVALLDKPVDSSGVLLFTPPDRLEKRTLRPRPESLVVDRASLTTERDGKRRTLALGDFPEAASLITGIRETLAGDLGALTRDYSAALEGNAARWRLTLRPLDASATQWVERIELTGAEWRVATVEVVQPGGDRSVMTISPAK